MNRFSTKRTCCAAAIGTALLLCSHAHAQAQEQASPLTIGGAIRFNYVYKGWQPEKPRGFVGLDTARLDVNYDDGTRIASAQYRYNRFPTGQGGYWQHFLHHAWAGLRFADKSTLQVGVTKVPFGLMPFASNNFYQSIAFYAGFEDKYDAGISYASAPGKLEWQLAFFPRDGGSYGGGDNTAPGANRYSYNIVRDDDEHGYGTGQHDSERNTLVARMAWHAGSAVKHEFGASLLAGDIRNGAGQDSRRNAFAAHYRAQSGPYEAMLQAVRYHYRTRHGATETYGGLDPNSFVMVGGFGYPYPVATRGDIYIANISRAIPGTLGPFSGFKIYNDYSALHKRVAGFGPSKQNVTGLSFAAGKWAFQADFMLGKHHPYISPDFGGMASTAGQNDRWARRINLQAGFYF